MRVGVAVGQRQHREQRVERGVGIDGQRRQRVAQARPPLLDLGVERLAPAPRVARRLVPLDAAHHRLAQAIAAERLGQVVDDALAQARDRGRDVLHPGRHDDRGLGPFLPDLLSEPQPVVSRHPDVAERHGGRRLVEPRQRFVGVRGGPHVVATGDQPAAHEIPYAELVVHDEDRCGHWLLDEPQGIRVSRL